MWAQSSDWVNGESREGSWGWMPVDVCIGCVNVVKSAVFVVGIAVHLLTCCVPRSKDACAMTAPNGVEVVFFGARRRGRVGGECRFRRGGESS